MISGFSESCDGMGQLAVSLSCPSIGICNVQISAIGIPVVAFLVKYSLSWLKVKD